jgi:hypothetical protein
MKVADYKGYEIEFIQEQFSIKGISGWFDRYKDAISKIDRVLKAEVKANFPMDAVSNSMKAGKITSYNKLEKEAWFSPENDSRGKERIVDYRGQSRFYKANDNNLTLVKRYAELSDAIAKLNKEQVQLEKGLTEPITFETTED